MRGCLIYIMETYACTAMLEQRSSSQVFTVTNIYGLTEDAEKPLFIEELRRISTLITGPWILTCGFILVRWLIDRSGDMRGWSLRVSLAKQRIVLEEW
jgi:hypothetical protein